MTQVRVQPKQAPSRPTPTTRKGNGSDAHDFALFEQAVSRLMAGQIRAHAKPEDEPDQREPLPNGHSTTPSDLRERERDRRRYHRQVLESEKLSSPVAIIGRVKKGLARAAIEEAEDALDRAEQEGRTVEMWRAEDMLEVAWAAFRRGRHTFASEYAHQAQDIAEDLITYEQWKLERDKDRDKEGHRRQRLQRKQRRMLERVRAERASATEPEVEEPLPPPRFPIEKARRAARIETKRAKKERNPRALRRKREQDTSQDEGHLGIRLTRLERQIKRRLAHLADAGIHASVGKHATKRKSQIKDSLGSKGLSITGRTRSELVKEVNSILLLLTGPANTWHGGILGFLEDVQDYHPEISGVPQALKHAKALIEKFESLKQRATGATTSELSNCLVGAWTVCREAKKLLSAEHIGQIVRPLEQKCDHNDSTLRKGKRFLAAMESYHHWDMHVDRFSYSWVKLHQSETGRGPDEQTIANVRSELSRILYRMERRAGKQHIPDLAKYVHEFTHEFRSSIDFADEADLAPIAEDARSICLATEQVLATHQSHRRSPIGKYRRQWRQDAQTCSELLDQLNTTDKTTVRRQESTEVRQRQGKRNGQVEQGTRTNNGTWEPVFEQVSTSPFVGVVPSDANLGSIFGSTHGTVLRGRKARIRNV